MDSLRTVDQILRDAAEINRLHAQINVAVAQRHQSPQPMQQWRQACTQWHVAQTRLLGCANNDFAAGLRQGDPVMIEAALRFLQADPYCFGSGYARQMIWPLLGGRCILMPRQLRQLEQSALLYLDRRIQNEFWAMAKVMSRRASTHFWEEVKRAARFLPSARQRRACWLLVFKDDVQAGMRQRPILHREWRAESRRR